MNKLWIVCNPSFSSELSDFCYPIVDSAHLGRLVVGTGLQEWESRRYTVHHDEIEAKKDAKERAGAASKGFGELYGRILP